MTSTSSHQGKIIEPWKLNQDKASEIPVIYLGVDPTKVTNEIGDTKGVHARCNFLKELYKTHINGNDMHFRYHQTCAQRCHLLFPVSTSIDMDKSTTYMVYTLNTSLIH